MIELLFALLDIRRLFHVALVAMLVPAVQTFGSPGMRLEVNRLVVTPVVQVTSVVGRQLDAPIAALRSVAKGLGWN